ncbi:hypothetical protein TCAL_07482 [Tigriopus californicus]|uniref:Reelin domain-containing protein n=1 Tax=Tigriopus californicus TaxID=6832 RepID=A0A553NSP3_TIGCA|nr:putative defense protein 2 [Tigriopus californicus]TRY68429.1 hypothetical protein TCAL_07482 [Tigriopus californicus]|eukprot:TCALIF_07482-PA protein Name:"Similar to Putative defense protein (Bombyx mori)" AED:0.16 eAED:0.16 QI:0/-1/0/1/-1/1/1/0/268
MTKWQCWVIWSILSLLQAHPSQARSDGAPLEACDTMIPGHQDTSPKPGQSALHEVSIAKGLEPGAFIISLHSAANVPFKGFFIQARNVAKNNSEAIGTWDISNLSGVARTANCSGQPNSAVTHVDNQLKTSVTFTWQSPRKYTGRVVFEATVVQDFHNYWTGIRSSELPLLAGISQSGFLDIKEPTAPKAMAVNVETTAPTPINRLPGPVESAQTKNNNTKPLNHHDPKTMEQIGLNVTEKHFQSGGKVISSEVEKIVVVFVTLALIK